MEFGLFLNGYIPGPGAHDSDWEHRQLMREAEYASRRVLEGPLEPVRLK